MGSPSQFIKDALLPGSQTGLYGAQKTPLCQQRKRRKRLEKNQTRQRLFFARRSNQGRRSNQQQRATQTQQIKSSKLCFVTDDQAASMQQGLVVAAREN